MAWKFGSAWIMFSLIDVGEFPRHKVGIAATMRASNIT